MITPFISYFIITQNSCHVNSFEKKTQKMARKFLFYLFQSNFYKKIRNLLSHFRN